MFLLVQKLSWRSRSILLSAPRRSIIEGFADAGDVFAGPVFERVDDRRDDGEQRVRTIGFLAGRMVVVVWTARAAARHIISMRKANDREQQRYRSELD